MKYFLSFFLSLSALSQSSPQCPSESYLIEYTSPTSGAKKALCGYQKDGSTVKHGEEFIYNTNGEVVKKITYNHGIEGEKPVFKGNNLPGTEEASHTFIDSMIGKKVLSSEEKLLNSIHDLMEILTLKKGYGQKNRFKVNGCDNRPMDWVKGAFLNIPIKKSYSFKDNCDVMGSFEAIFNKEFPMSFKLRNLDDLINTSLKVTMSLNKQETGLRYKFIVVDGSISSPSRHGQFTAEYQVDINPITGEAQKGTQSGKINLTKVNDKEVILSQNIEF